ncbi:MAG: NAD(P)-dependent oxidoreductase [Schleiferiaceae bacterium]|nr:NAD(P)-dependent oxidoreductase [Schleiferiaceae bacterium]
MVDSNTWVLGATGFVGGAVVASLLEQKLPHEKLTTLVHKTLPPPHFEHCNTLTGSLEQFDFSWLKRFPPTGLVHAARMAGSHPIMRKVAAHKGRKANEKWLRVLGEMNPNLPIVYVSGTLMYGNLEKGVVAREQQPLHPIAFAKHYHTAEKPFEYAHQAQDVRMVRPAWIIGPHSWFYHFYYLPAIKQGVVPIYGDGEQLMSLIHIRDCGGLITHALKKGTPNTNYNIFAAPPIKQVDFAALVAKLLQVKVAPYQPNGAQKQLKSDELAALTSNIPVGTQHTDWFAAYNFLYPTVAEMVTAVLTALEAGRSS